MVLIPLLVIWLCPAHLLCSKIAIYRRTEPRWPIIQLFRRQGPLTRQGTAPAAGGLGDPVGSRKPSYQQAAPGEVRQRGMHGRQRRNPQSAAARNATRLSNAGTAKRRLTQQRGADGVQAQRVPRDGQAGGGPRRQRTRPRRAERVAGPCPAPRPCTGVPRDSSDRTPLPRDRLQRGARRAGMLYPVVRGRPRKVEVPIPRMGG